MGFYDSKGYYRSPEDGFYDAKGYYRSPGDGFYDAKGYYRSPGDGFYDSKGYYRSPGDGFYDARGNWVGGAVVYSEVDREGITAGVAFILFLPIGLIWIFTTMMVEWINTHQPIVMMGYAIISAILCLVLVKSRKHYGIQRVLSFIGNYACMFSLILVVLWYGVPCVIEEGGSFGSFCEFTLTLGFGVGGAAIVQCFNAYHKKAFLEFIVGIVFLVTILLILK